MTSQSRHFVPPPEASGGTQGGNSYLQTWVKCPRLWYNTYYRPTRDEGGKVLSRGLRLPHSSRHILTGDAGHDGLQRLYESGIRDGEDTGEWDVDFAVDTARAKLQTHKPKYQLVKDFEEAYDTLPVIIRDYYEKHGPEAPRPDYPNIKILCDDQGAPMIERELRAELAPGYVYTCRFDALITDMGFIKALEHKFTTAYGINMRLKGINTETQFTGEYWVIQQCYPEVDLNGVLLNMLIKNRSLTGKYKDTPAVRETTTRSPGTINRWKISAIGILDSIDDAIDRFENLTLNGDSDNYASEVCFPDHGTRTEQCHAFGSKCDYLHLCQLPGLEDRRLAQYNANYAVGADAS
jgi:hypothetical protein